MKVLTIEEYRNKILPHLSGCGAFLRISRNEDLFVTDAPARIEDTEALRASLAEEFDTVIKDKCMYITPRFDTDRETASEILSILKSARAKRNMLLRQSLSKAMRNKNGSAKAFFEDMLKGEQESC